MPQPQARQAGPRDQQQHHTRAQGGQGSPAWVSNAAGKASGRHSGMPTYRPRAGRQTGNGAYDWPPRLASAVGEPVRANPCARALNQKGPATARRRGARAGRPAELRACNWGSRCAAASTGGTGVRPGAAKIGVCAPQRRTLQERASLLCVTQLLVSCRAVSAIRIGDRLVPCA